MDVLYVYQRLIHNFVLHSYTLIIIGVAKGANPELEQLVTAPSRMVMVQSVAELVAGRVGFEVISKIFKDVDYSKLVVING